METTSSRTASDRRAPQRARLRRPSRRRGVLTAVSAASAASAIALATVGQMAGASAATALSYRSVSAHRAVRDLSRLSVWSGPHSYGHHSAKRPQSPHEGSRAMQRLVYHGGPVMLTATTYAIYWQPSSLQSGSSDAVPASYDFLLTRFFEDVGGHGLFTDVTQYYEGNGTNRRYIENTGSFGGTYLDTDPYPPAGKYCRQEVDCVTEVQLQAEIERIMVKQGWTAGRGHVFFIFTAKGEDTCDSSGCASASNGWCGSHYDAPVTGSYLVYAVLPFDDPAGCGNYQNGGFLPSPNNDRFADDEISTSSHELFESVTDPLGTAWFDNGGNEIADKCDAATLPLTWDGGTANQSWNGHFYTVQDEFDNHTSSCVQTGP